MQDFKAYLSEMRICGYKAVDFYIHWVTQFYRFAHKCPGEAVTDQEKEAYLRHLSKNRESWQVDQAEKAIALYLFHEKRKEDNLSKTENKSSDQWKATVDGMRRMLRLMHRSYRTEQAYIGWVRRFY